VIDDDIFARDSDIESEADAFAAYLLAPDEAMRAAMPGTDRRLITVEDVAGVMHRFGISFRTAVYRLHNSRRILAEDRNRLLAEGQGNVQRIMRALGYDREALAPGDPLPGWYVLQVTEMLRGGTLDVDRAAQLLRRAREAVEDLVREDGAPADDGAETELRELLGEAFDELAGPEDDINP
jgi:Zn-dependent peptidase ImmA (M78 family)